MTDRIAALPFPVPPAAASMQPPPAATMKAARAFEAMTLGQLLRPMFDTLDQKGGFFGGGAAEETWRPMLVDEMAKSIVRGGGLGLAAPVYREMLRSQEAAAPGKERS